MINGLRAKMLRNVKLVKENKFNIEHILNIFDGELICVDEGKELEELLLSDRVIFVIVALSTADGESQHGRTHNFK